MHKWVCPESCCHLVNSHCPIYVLKSVLRCWSPSVYKWTPAPTSQMIAYAALSILCLLKPSIHSCTPSQLGKCLCIICKMRNGAECIIKIKAPCYHSHTMARYRIFNQVLLPQTCSPTMTEKNSNWICTLQRLPCHPVKLHPGLGQQRNCTMKPVYGLVDRVVISLSSMVHQIYVKGYPHCLIYAIDLGI